MLRSLDTCKLNNMVSCIVFKLNINNSSNQEDKKTDLLFTTNSLITVGHAVFVELCQLSLRECFQTSSSLSTSPAMQGKQYSFYFLYVETCIFFKVFMETFV